MKSTEMSKPAPSTGSAKFVNSQRQDQYLASKFKGTDVVGSDSQKIGDVSDILFDKDGKIEAYVVGVGGFLGIGAKDVALAPTAFEVVRGRQVQERVRQAEALHDQGRAEAGGELRAVQGPECRPPACGGTLSSRPMAARGRRGRVRLRRSGEVASRS